MTDTSQEDSPAPLSLRLVARGEGAIRMEKRLECASRATGIPVRLQTEPGDVGEIQLWMQDTLLAEGLLSAEALDRLLRHLSIG